MGVLRYFYHLYKTKKGFWDALQASRPFHVDILCIDCNAVFHPAVKEIFFPETISLLRRPKTYDELELIAFDNVIKHLQQIIHQCPPGKILYLAVDGVAGMCKQSQQRKRRYKAAQERQTMPDKHIPTSDGKRFDGCALSCGTPFMKRLSAHIQQWILKIKQYPYQSLTIIFDGMDVVSEGEHKLVKFVNNYTRTRPRTSYCIYSPDADLIFLSLCIPRGKGTILRPNIYRKVQASHILVHCNRLRNILIESLTTSTLLAESTTTPSLTSSTTQTQTVSTMMPLDVSHEKMLIDYILILFLCGNDFLPCMYAYEINNEGIDVIAQSYLHAVHTHGPIITSGNHISLDSFLCFFKALADKESAMLVQKCKSILHNDALQKGHTDPLLTTNVQFDEETKVGVLNMDTMRRQYYENKFHITSDDDIGAICKAYVRGLHFVITYYTSSIPSYDWYYEYHYAPLACDIYQYLCTFKEKSSLQEWHEMQQWTYVGPLTQKQALLGVIPPSSVEVLPEELQPVMNKLANSSKHKHLFSETFDVDLDGKMQDYEGICLLPNITYKQLKQFYKDSEEVQSAIQY